MTAFISPYSDDRDEARKLIGDDFIEYEILKRADEGGSDANVKDFLEDYKIRLEILYL